jgi:hypothetical protein
LGGLAPRSPVGWRHTFMSLCQRLHDIWGGRTSVGEYFYDFLLRGLMDRPVITPRGLTSCSGCSNGPDVMHPWLTLLLTDGTWGVVLQQRMSYWRASNLSHFTTRRRSRCKTLRPSSISQRTMWGRTARRLAGTDYRSSTLLLQSARAQMTSVRSS